MAHDTFAKKPPDRMTATSYGLHGVRAFACALDGKKLRIGQDVVDWIGEPTQHGAEFVLVPVERLDDDFFRLGTGVAGDIVQKCATYRRRLAIAGDISRYLDLARRLLRRNRATQW